MHRRTAKKADKHTGFGGHAWIDSVRSSGQSNGSTEDRGKRAKDFETCKCVYRGGEIVRARHPPQRVVIVETDDRRVRGQLWKQLWVDGNLK